MKFYRKGDDIMKFLKGLVVALVLISVTGCIGGNRTVRDETISEAYQSMQIERGGISGYVLDLRVSGEINGSSINEIVRINNNNNNDFQITYIDALNYEENEQEFYIIDGVKYGQNSDGEYVETEKELRFSDTNLILEGLNNVVELSEPRQETIANNVYSVYDAVVRKDIVDEILESGNINLIPEENVETKIYINEDGHVYRIIYNIEDLRLSASFFSIDNPRQVHLPESDDE